MRVLSRISRVVLVLSTSVSVVMAGTTAVAQTDGSLSADSLQSGSADSGSSSFDLGSLGEVLGSAGSSEGGSSALGSLGGRTLERVTGNAGEDGSFLLTVGGATVSGPAGSLPGGARVAAETREGDLPGITRELAEEASGSVRLDFGTDVPARAVSIKTRIDLPADALAAPPILQAQNADRSVFFPVVASYDRNTGVLSTTIKYASSGGFAPAADGFAPAQARSRTNFFQAGWEKVTTFVPATFTGKTGADIAAELGDLAGVLKRKPECVGRSASVGGQTYTVTPFTISGASDNAFTQAAWPCLTEKSGRLELKLNPANFGAYEVTAPAGTTWSVDPPATFGEIVQTTFNELSQVPGNLTPRGQRRGMVTALSAPKYTVSASRTPATFTLEPNMVAWGATVIPVLVAIIAAKISSAKEAAHAVDALIDMPSVWDCMASMRATNPSTEAGVAATLNAAAHCLIDNAGILLETSLTAAGRSLFSIVGILLAGISSVSSALYSIYTEIAALRGVKGRIERVDSSEPPTSLPSGLKPECTGNVLDSRRIVHPTLGPARVFLVKRGTGSGFAGGCVAVIDKNGRALNQIPVDIYGTALRFPDRVTDATGNSFVVYNPGRYYGVIALVPTNSGYVNPQHLTEYGDTYYIGDNRYMFYHAELVGPGSNGRYTIRQFRNDCNPSCASGTITSKDFHWNGSAYVHS